MQDIQGKSQSPQTGLEDKVLVAFEQSLTEEQRFLQGILSGEIQTYSHEDVMADLRKALSF